jgi:hypothetical protein
MSMTSGEGFSQSNGGMGGQGGMDHTGGDNGPGSEAMDMVLDNLGMDESAFEQGNESFESDNSLDNNRSVSSLNSNLDKLRKMLEEISSVRTVRLLPVQVWKHGSIPTTFEHVLSLLRKLTERRT